MNKFDIYGLIKLIFDAIIQLQYKFSAWEAGNVGSYTLVKSLVKNTKINQSRNILKQFQNIGAVEGYSWKLILMSRWVCVTSLWFAGSALKIYMVVSHVNIVSISIFLVCCGLL